MRLPAFIESALDLILPPRDTARLVRECAEDAFLALMAPGVTGAGTITLLPYRHPQVRAAVVEAKFRRNPRAIHLLNRALSVYLEEGDIWDEAYALVPVPLGPEHRRTRGYNQTGEVAHGFPMESRLLMRTRETAPQTSLGRARRLANMTDAFAVTGQLRSGVTYIVFDDVTTTGATLAAARQAFMDAGAREVMMLALAH